MEQQKRGTTILDAEGKILGRLVSEAAKILQGKNKPSYEPNTDCGDRVVIKNASKVKISGKKFSDKIYRHHTNHPGGLKEKTYKEVFAKDPREVIHLGIIKMLPKNKLRNRRLTRLVIEK
ncbi:MAG: 50S ribosomal protein L13 [Candidatus Magasanikbacteria bacterium GW2011_GWC2_40_17]|uniref:Large ribosomal subunit protein uL13 n=1 Tax=Candidatus Magasanikbacteria bacterium GW2011_GWA2_42_32 TaxID=1619039 RepID=A0A0G1D5Y3_9BACT|nr:MAG: 50S ribosomal protein L13 [Candidatus Magasanikbacteria bacterium GW2011_GWC2_40_17]KKS57473.1 MAG: 50S ribosomal protein L13 [Candidatus Magasanikbacteria bacterium GW2011_GWA2_42_32]OGH85190.1 MAG: 50S ribosomal protein L13 [Candidatus Magasanikbacteria bacterium RIFOXYB2_FULL_38_10]